MASGDIVFLKGDKGGRFPDANSIFIDDEIPTVIDPATRRRELERIQSEHGVELVIDTHYHVDHIRYNDLFPDASFLAHQRDAAAISSIDELARFVGVDNQPWQDAWRIAIRDVYGYSETRVARVVSGGEEIELGQNTVRIINTPGHTPGHICLEFVEKRAVYLADIDLTPFGPWYGNRCSDIEEFLESIERLKGLDAETWYTSHEEGIIRGDIRERLGAYAGVIHERENRLLDFLSGERTFSEIVERTLIYGKRWDPPQMFEFFEGMMVRKHLDRLLREGQVIAEDNRFVRKS